MRVGAVLPNTIFKVTTAKTVPTGSAEAIVSSTPANFASQGVLIQSLSTNTVSVYVGDSAVTTSTGIELQPGEELTLQVANPATIYCIAGSASQVLRVGWA